MRSFPREIESRLVRAARDFPAVVVTGPRRAGKTFSLRRAFPRASYHLLEDPEVLARIGADPRGWIEDVRTPAILDEVQNAPEILRWVRARVDEEPARKGRWLLTGSQDFGLMQGVTESMAGRAAVFQMLPLSALEAGGWDLVLGGYPEVRLRPRSARDWFRSYVQTYLERDVRAVTAVRDLGTFRRFLGLLATRSGALLNRADLAAPLGVSVPTISAWISILETTGVIMTALPWFENLGKRLVKTPKVYFTDTGLLCFLLGMGSPAALASSPLAGVVFEAFLASEIAKAQGAVGDARQVFFFRDPNGLEIDFIVPRRDGSVLLAEAKLARTVVPRDARWIEDLAPRFSPRRARGFVVHRGGRGGAVPPQHLGRHTRAATVEDFLELLRR